MSKQFIYRDYFRISIAEELKNTTFIQKDKAMQILIINLKTENKHAETIEQCYLIAYDISSKQPVRRNY